MPASTCAREVVPLNFARDLCYSAVFVLALLPLVAAAASYPSEWPQLGVRVNKLGLRKAAIADCCFPGSVRSIQLGNFDGDRHLEIGAVAQSGVLLLDATTLKRKAALDYTTPDGERLWLGLSPYLVRDNDGFKIAKRGGGFGDVGLLDQSGRELWKFRPDPKLPPNGMVVDDTRTELRFYVCDYDVIYRLDRTGKVVWRVAEVASYITLVRDTADQETAFATADPGTRTLTIWSATGSHERQLELPHNPDGIASVSNGEVSGFVTKSGRQVAFIDRRGSHHWTYSYGNLPIMHGPSAELVRLLPGEPPLLAVRVGSSSATGRSVLTLFSMAGNVLYEEYLGSGSGLGVAPVANQNRERLLAGDGTTKLWMYEIVP